MWVNYLALFAAMFCSFVAGFTLGCGQFHSFVLNLILAGLNAFFVVLALRK